MWDGNLGYIIMYDVCITILLLLCVNYVPVYKVQCKKSAALMDRDDAEMFTVLLLIYELNNHHLQAE